MKQEAKKIGDFKPGDIVTRIEPVAQINQHMFMGGLSYDDSFIGEKLIFVGIANGCAYFEAAEDFNNFLEKGKLVSIKIHNFENGWAYYIDPVTLLNKKPESRYSKMSNESLVEELDGAIEVEDYEEASRIKHEIDKRDK